jgi:hypothetical protein
MDSSYQSATYHCLMKSQWMDQVADWNFVDGLEFYALDVFENPKCTLPAVVVQPPLRRAANPSAYLLFETLRFFLARSQAGWLFLIGDAAFVKTQKLEAHLKHCVNRWYHFSSARGSCVERRYFFQMLSIQSGVLINRQTVEHMINHEEMWNVTIATGLPADEALSQVLDAVGVDVKGSKDDHFLGQPFRNRSFNSDLLEQSFDHLKVCKRPDGKPEKPSIASVCSSEITRFNDVIVWAGGGRDAVAKEWFLTHAQAMIDGVPDSVHFIWDRLFPELCLKR